MDLSVVEFAAAVSLEQLPTAVIKQAKRCLLDLVGVAAAGSATQMSSVTRDFAATHFGSTARPSRLVFDGRETGPLGAALANGMTIDAFDAHDGHPLAKGHAGCGVFAALAAVADAEEAISGKEFLVLLVVGYEIAIRAGIALHATAGDYHASGAWSAVGAAALAGRVLSLQPCQMRQAMGIAEYHGPRSPMMHCIDYPSMVKDGSGWGAMAGLAAAYLARAGFTGAPAKIVDSDETSRYWNDLGTRWRMLEQYFKAYPVCRWAQPAIEAALQLRRGHAFDVAAIESITVRTFHEACRLSTAEPVTTEAAQYSLPFPLATILAKGLLGADEIDQAGLDDPEALRLSRSVILGEDPRFSQLFPAERWAQVEISLRDGTRLSSEPAIARGSAENPFSNAEICAKYHDLMQTVGLGERASRIAQMVSDLDDLPTVKPLLDAVCRSAAPRANQAERLAQSAD